MHFLRGHPICKTSRQFGLENKLILQANVGPENNMLRLIVSDYPVRTLERWFILFFGHHHQAWWCYRIPQIHSSVTFLSSALFQAVGALSMLISHMASHQLLSFEVVLFEADCYLNDRKWEPEVCNNDEFDDCHLHLYPPPSPPVS